MAIVLRVEPWCENCVDFESTSTVLTYDNKHFKTIVKCKHEKFCERLVDHLKEELEKENKDEEVVR